MSSTQEKIEEFWGKCFHPATKVVYTTDHYKVGKEEFISIVSGFINQARDSAKREGAIEELKKLLDFPIAVTPNAHFGYDDMVFLDDIKDRIAQLEQSEESI